jgi:hypothetical protein
MRMIHTEVQPTDMWKLPNTRPQQYHMQRPNLMQVLLQKTPIHQS